MTELLLCTHNKNKVAELRTLLSCDDYLKDKIKVLSLSDIGSDEEIAEDGATFEENSLIKAGFGASMGYISVADDSGLCVDALGGAPGVYSARYAGEPCDDEKNNDLLLCRLSDVPEGERTGRYEAVIACVFPDGRSFTVKGSCEGKILFQRDGDGGFGYDPLFWQTDLKKTFARTTPEEKNSVSHRGKAMRLFCTEFRKYI